MKYVIILFTSILFLTFSACKKNQLGGKSKIKGIVNHHGKPIANATVYIKFDAKEFPGEDVSVYNTSVTADASGYYEINCYKGNYYLYGKGIDPAIAAPYTVLGGLPVTIRNKETLTKDLAVTED